MPCRAVVGPDRRLDPALPGRQLRHRASLLRDHRLDRPGPIRLARRSVLALLREPATGCHRDAAWRRLRRQAGISDCRLHDFRHTTITYAARAGFKAFLVRDLLSHKTVPMTGRYVERTADPIRAAADAVAGRVAAAMSGELSEEVIELSNRMS